MNDGDQNNDSNQFEITLQYHIESNKITRSRLQASIDNILKSIDDQKSHRYTKQQFMFYKSYLNRTKLETQKYQIIINEINSKMIPKLQHQKDAVENAKERINNQIQTLQKYRQLLNDCIQNPNSATNNQLDINNLVLDPNQLISTLQSLNSVLDENLSNSKKIIDEKRAQLRQLQANKAKHVTGNAMDEWLNEMQSERKLNKIIQNKERSHSQVLKSNLPNIQVNTRIQRTKSTFQNHS